MSLVLLLLLELLSLYVFVIIICCCCFSVTVMSDSLWLCGLQQSQASLSFTISEFAKTQVHWVGDAIQPSHFLSPPSVSPFSSCPQSFPSSGSFPMSWLFTSGGQGIRASESALPMNTQDWSSLGWTSWISVLSKGLSRVFCCTTVQKHQFFGAHPSLRFNSHLYMTWKIHSFDYMNLCWQSDISAF